jgi:ribosomal protein S18 acetylase RimI-like enzyme
MDDIENPENFSIREYCEEDYTEVANFWEITELGNPARGDTDLTIKRTIEMGGCLLVMYAKKTGRICGTSWLTTDGRRTMLHHFGILPEYQGNGLSKILLERSLQFAKQKNYQVKLEVHSGNVRAINLYKRFGFVHLGEYDVYIIRDTSIL